MAWTEQELTALETAYKSGIKRVQFKDRSTEYRDLNELKQVLEEARKSLSNQKRKPHFYTSYNRGYQ